MVTSSETGLATPTITGIIDGDGHIRERDEDFYPYLSAKYSPERLQTDYLFTAMDGYRRAGGGKFGWDVDGWQQFMDWSHLSEAVLYPTLALGFAFSKPTAWAIDLARAYNDFLFDHYLKKNSRLKAVALLPVQDPVAAASELRRAVTELGMVGGLLPSVGLRLPYGHSAFDPIYEAAQSLDTMLAVHGAPRRELSLEWLADSTQEMILAHPLGEIIQFTNMIVERVFERFPRLRVAYLEAGCGWVPFLIERIDRLTEHQKGRALASSQVRNAAIYFHAELEEKEVLPFTLSVIGEDRFIYASDYPHESAETAAHALQEFLERKDVSEVAKEKILRDNIKDLYRLP